MEALVRRSKFEWDPSWDVDWDKAERDLEEEIEQGHPPEPEKAVEYYRHGFVTAKQHPAAEWPEVEQGVYEDYMSGLIETEEELPWEEARKWARAGWGAARAA